MQMRNLQIHKEHISIDFFSAYMFVYLYLHNITSKKQHLTQSNVQFNGILKAGYELTYNYANNPFQISTLDDNNYRTEGNAANDLTKKEHKYEYDLNGNLIYVNSRSLKIFNYLIYSKITLRIVVYNLHFLYLCSENTV